MTMSLLEAIQLNNSNRFKCSKWSNNIKLNSIEARSIESLPSRARGRLSWLNNRLKESAKSNNSSNN